MTALGAAGAPAARALPACDVLRECSGQLAVAYQQSGFPARVVRQYRRNAVAPFERGEAAQPGLCRRVATIIIKNAMEMHRRGRIKYLPPACSLKKLEQLP